MIYLVLISLFPFLTYINGNAEKINEFRDIFLIFGVSVSGSLICGYIFKKFTKKNTEDLLIIWISGVLLFFSYGQTVDFLGSFNPTMIKTSYVWIVLFFTAIYLAFKLSKNKNLQKIAKVFVVVICITPIVELTIFYAQKFFVKNKENSALEKDLNFNFVHKPNIYYILVDGYARQDTLKETLDYDNEPFLKNLENLGFAVSRQAHSNYHFTGASLSATMNMKYHEKGLEDTISYDQMHDSLKGDNPVRKVLKSNGYRIINMPAHWHQMACYGYEDVCIKKKGFEVYQSFLSSTPVRFFHFKNSYVDPDEIKRAIDVNKDNPKFIFAHLAQVHDAIYTQDGSVSSTLHPIYSNHENGKNYLSSIKIMNSKLLDLANEIKVKDPNSVIIIQADHGPTYVADQKNKDPGYWADHSKDLRIVGHNECKYTFGILSAVYISPSLKNKGSLHRYYSGKFSLVNTFRYLFAELSNQNPDLLKNESHFLFMNEDTKKYEEQDISQFINQGVQ